MSDLQSLIERVEKAMGGVDREIDALIVTTLCPGALVSQYIVGDDEPSVFHAQALGISDKSDVPNYTVDLNAALSLVAMKLPGAWWRIEQRDADKHASWATVGKPGEQEEADAATPALAIILALLRAVSHVPAQNEATEETRA